MLSFFQALGPGGRSNEATTKSSLEPPVDGITSDPSFDFDSNQALEINFDNGQDSEINFDSDQDMLNADSTEANEPSNDIPSTQPLTVSSTNRIELTTVYFIFSFEDNTIF